MDYGSFGLSFYYNNILYCYSLVGECNRWHTLDGQNVIFGGFFSYLDKPKQEIVYLERMEIINDFLYNGQ